MYIIEKEKTNEDNAGTHCLDARKVTKRMSIVTLR